MFNFKEVQDRLSSNNVIRIMKQLGVESFRETENEIIFPTICHNLDINKASLKLYYYKDKKTFYCYTECSKGYSIFTLLQARFLLLGEQEETIWRKIFSFFESSQLQIKENFSEYTQNTRYQKKQQNFIFQKYEESLMDIFREYNPIEWRREHITSRGLRHFNVRYSLSKNAMIIPHYSPNMELIGIRSRFLSPDAKAKYMPLFLERRMFNHPLSLNLYGLSHNKEAINKSRVVYVFEGEKSVYQAYTYGFENAVATCGYQIHKSQILLLKKYCPQLEEVVICFDKDVDNFQKLNVLANKFSNYYDFSFIFDNAHLLKNKDSPTDKGRETFLKLIKRRVKIQND